MACSTPIDGTSKCTAAAHSCTPVVAERGVMPWRTLAAHNAGPTLPVKAQVKQITTFCSVMALLEPHRATSIRIQQTEKGATAAASHLCGRRIEEAQRRVAAKRLSCRLSLLPAALQACQLRLKCGLALEWIPTELGSKDEADAAVNQLHSQQCCILTCAAATMPSSSSRCSAAPPSTRSSTEKMSYAGLITGDAVLYVSGHSLSSPSCSPSA